MPAALNGDYVLYQGLKASTLHLETDADGALVNSKLGNSRITGTFKAATGRLTFTRNLKGPGSGRSKHIYDGYPVSHIAGYRRSSNGRFWGWAGARNYSSTRAIRGPSTLMVGWWARPRTSYAEDIQPLFRQMDADAMRSFGLQLDSLDYLRDHARSVYDAVAYPTPSFVMPCDGAWPKEWTTLFKYWMDDGKPS